MADIYQKIWDADQAHGGVRAVRSGAAIDAATRAHGYVVVNDDRNAGPDHRVLGELVLPENKARSYRLAEALFNNYTLDQTKPEQNFPDEDAEVQAFLEAVH